MSVIAFSPSIGPVEIDCFLSERHQSDLEITMNPIELGADVTDHAYVQPKRVVIEVADESAVNSWNALMRFQAMRIPFVLVTGLSVYRNMLIKSLDAERDQKFSRILKGRAVLQEIIIVDTSYAAADGFDVVDAGQPGGVKSVRQARPVKGRATDGITADRATGTVQRGDVAGTAANVADQSILSLFFGARP